MIFSLPPMRTRVGADVVTIIPPTPNAFSDADIATYQSALQDVIDASIANDESDAKAKTDDARKKYVGWASSFAGLAGGPVAGKMAGDYAGAIFDAGHWIASTFGPDDLKAANTDDQKSRMRDKVAFMLKKGLPPHGFAPTQQMGARDVANVIDDDLLIIGAVSPHGEVDQIAFAIKQSLLGHGSKDATNRVSELFTQLAIVRTDTRRTMWGGATATYLIDFAGQMKPGTDNWQITHPEIEIVAAAFAAQKGVSLDAVTKTAYQAINTYASRRGFTTRNDFLGAAYHPRDPLVTDDVAHWLNLNARADAIVDAWNVMSSSPLPPNGAIGGGPSIGQDTVKLAVAGGGIYLGYKYLWPIVKGWFHR